MATSATGVLIFDDPIYTYSPLSWKAQGEFLLLLRISHRTNPRVDRIVLVDSTRSGKRIPDALSKTIPIWCSVINRAMLKRFPEIQRGNWDISLYTPPTSVSSQEHDQIARKLDKWADALAVRTLL